jgi:hypothetical protein
MLLQEPELGLEFQLIEASTLLRETSDRMLMTGDTLFDVGIENWF